MTIDEMCSCGARFQLTIGDDGSPVATSAALVWRRDHLHTPPPIPDAAQPVMPLQDWERALLDAEGDA